MDDDRFIEVAPATRDATVAPATPFNTGEVRAQELFGTTQLWDAARREQLLWDEIPAVFHERIEAANFFFLATADAAGCCDCSFKGGGPGLIRVLNAKCFAFPDFDGNGAFMSLGNILENPRVGCLFIDFEDAARLRVNGRAEIRTGDEATVLFPGASRVIVVHIEQVVPNCSAHVPRLVPGEPQENLPITPSAVSHLAD